jgi:predicted RNA binding protein YcfA (HicA-like mRNA interferase family)
LYIISIIYGVIEYTRKEELDVSKIAKLYNKLSQYPTPSDIRFDEVHRLLSAYGFIQRQPSGGGSHYVYTHPELEIYELTIPKSGGKVKKGYIKKVIEAVDIIREIQGGECT